MRITRWTIPALLAIATVFASRISQAQTASTTASAPAAPTTGCTGLPYSAKETQTEIQTNADGATTEHSHIQLVWRDADGRTRQEMISKTRTGEESKERYVNVYEPVKRVRWTWYYGGSSKKVAFVHPFQEHEGPASCPTPPAPEVKHNPGDFLQELLPPTTINGIPVAHNRNSKVVPASKDGSDREYTIAHEWWISPDLGIIMRRTIDDPRMAKIVTELSDVSRAVPEPALFQVPEGYDIREVPRPVPTPLDQILGDTKPVIPAPPSR
ncbi:MAG: hypothetical protein WBV36_15985 [Terriglobales bacterium]